VERLLAKHPERRTRSCAEVEQALLPFVNDPRPPALVRAERGFAKTAPLPAPVATAPLPSASEPQAPASSRRRLWLAIAASALLAMLLGAAVVVLPWRTSPRDEPATVSRPIEASSTPGPAPSAAPDPSAAPSPAAPELQVTGAALPSAPPIALPSTTPTEPTAPVSPASTEPAPAAPTVASELRDGTISVHTITYGAIFVDGRRMGAGDASVRLPAGTHRVAVGSNARTRVVELRPGQHLRLRGDPRTGTIH
ncbi:MAG: hypothetical protein IT378_25690, partial [Sandaracinaceae bacterium]|nr:hypothetical protein [Sandaracinaceae bacterium]